MHTDSDLARAGVNVGHIDDLKNLRTAMSE